MQEEVENWKKSSRYDLECASDMFAAKKYNYAVLFCHQAIEKILKAIILSKKGTPRRTHDLKERLGQAGLEAPGEMVNILLRLNPHYMVTRYPDVTGTANYENYDAKTASEFLKETEKVHLWLDKKIV